MIDHLTLPVAPMNLSHLSPPSKTYETRSTTQLPPTPDPHGHPSTPGSPARGRNGRAALLSDLGGDDAQEIVVFEAVFSSEKCGLWNGSYWFSYLLRMDDNSNN